MVLALSVIPAATNLPARGGLVYVARDARRCTASSTSWFTSLSFPDVTDDESVERALITSLWAQDWDSPEDSVYDDM